MKQIDFESSNYKNKGETKTFLDSINDLTTKFIKSYDNKDADMKKIVSNIDKKKTVISKLEADIADLSKKTDELKALKELSNSEISVLNTKKSEISYTDSEVQKMELDDINSQIAQKRNKISKIDAKVDATKSKIKSDNEEKKISEKELKDLEKERLTEEENLYRTEALIGLVDEIKSRVNSRVIEILNEPYKPKEYEVVKDEVEEVGIESESSELEIDVDVVSDLDEGLKSITLEEENVVSDIEPIDFDAVIEPMMNDVIESKKEEKKPNVKYDKDLIDAFKKEKLDFNAWDIDVKNKMQANKALVLDNLNTLKNHSVPLSYTSDQPEIYYDITNKDLDDLLSIITTDNDGNGMGFAIDFTFNILSELSKINVDKLIDVYNSEFMNVNAKSGIIHLLKLTNPGLTNFTKNREANVSTLTNMGIKKVPDIVKKYPDFVDMDYPLFLNVINVFDKDDLVEKLNSDIDVVPKILDYWKNN